jgi:fermentation-respiration switch protein FrsA (DUF1100 family)
MATEENLPYNVKLVTADCGYSSPKGILLKVIDEMKLPAKTLYPFVKAGARIFGRFDLEEASPIEAARKCKIPIIFIHGDSDTYVPFEMSKAMFDNCSSEKKRLVKIQGAGHAFSYLVASEQYIKALREAEKEWNI